MSIIKDAPEEIYLVIEGVEPGDTFKDCHDVTWEAEQINDNDVKYIRADKLAALEADAARMDWIQKNLLCADWEYPQGEKKTQPVICISWPASVGISGNLRSSIDDAMKGGA